MKARGTPIFRLLHGCCKGGAGSTLQELYRWDINCVRYLIGPNILYSRIKKLLYLVSLSSGAGKLNTVSISIMTQDRISDLAVLADPNPILNANLYVLYCEKELAHLRV